ncbi:F420-dependent glucose-6-phosphate dehydrogenase [Baekduia alba]|uniref:LLM class flavin-dependent oxidoreductase n=1 Tax=Baekduia alba TaxID=2997333 RepID=UPI00233F90B6|nr:LLM class flavin-dependent oxidoreductase [Baekduia alba]WCB95348.1 F420-dependent glucose-6-phosphate dehydrogenase [Baekduia alba]
MSSPLDAPLSFGIKTVPVGVGYEDLLRVWREADAIPAVEHAWLWDHLLPLFGDPGAPAFEGWTLLAVLAAQTRRLQVGLMVASNRIRPPAVHAKMAATLDVITGGRLAFGIGVGATGGPSTAAGQELADREFGAYGLELVSPTRGIAALDEACTIARRLWTEPDPFDFAGESYMLVGARCEPKPVQRPYPPIVIGAWGRRTLAVVARHADIWNVPGPPHNTVAFLRERAAVLDEHCAAIGRDPSSITRSTQVTVSYDDPAATRGLLAELIDAGFHHLVLGLRSPYPGEVAHWAAAELIEPTCRQRRPA